MTEKVRAIGPNGITPQLVLEKVAEDLEEIEDIFIVTFNKTDGHTVYASGNLGKLALASVTLHALAITHLSQPG